MNETDKPIPRFGTIAWMKALFEMTLNNGAHKHTKDWRPGPHYAPRVPKRQRWRGRRYGSAGTPSRHVVATGYLSLNELDKAVSLRLMGCDESRDKVDRVKCFAKAQKMLDDMQQRNPLDSRGFLEYVKLENAMEKFYGTIFASGATERSSSPTESSGGEAAI